MAEKGHRIDPWDFKELIQIQDIEDLTNELSGKAPINHTHTTIEVNGLTGALDGKAAIVHGHAVADIPGLQDAIDGKAEDLHGHAIDDVVGLQSALSAKADGGALLSHTMDSGKHTTAADKNFWNSKADGTHFHVVDDVDGLQDALDAKVDASAVGVADGVASLDASGKVPATQLPAAGGLEISTVYSGTPVLGATITPTFPAGKYLLLIMLTHSGSGGRTILYSGTVVAWSTSTYTGDTAAIYVEGSSASFTIGGSSTATISVVITAIKLGDL